MKENELIFDREKHVCYSEAVKKVIQDRLKKQFPEQEAEKLWEKIQQKYVEYLKTLPYLGGTKDTHNSFGGTTVLRCLRIMRHWTGNLLFRKSMK